LAAIRPPPTPPDDRLFSSLLGRLQRIDALLRAGLNLAGIAMVLDLQDENQRLHQRLDQ